MPQAAGKKISYRRSRTKPATGNDKNSGKASSGSRKSLMKKHMKSGKVKTKKGY